MINSFNIQGILIGDYDVTGHPSTLKIFKGHSTISPTNISGSNTRRYVIKIDDEIISRPPSCSFITNRHFWNIKHSVRVSEREGMKKIGCRRLTKLRKH